MMKSDLLEQENDTSGSIHYIGTGLSFSLLPTKIFVTILLLNLLKVKIQKYYPLRLSAAA
jgi:hypothetical protein